MEGALTIFAAQQQADAALGVAHVAEDDGIGGTRLSTGCHNLAILRATLLLFSLELTQLNTLNTERALLHYTTGPYGHIRV